VEALRELARRFGVLTEHQTDEGPTVDVGIDSLVAVLAARGAELAHPDEAAAALRAARAAEWRELVPPTIVAWDGQLAGVQVRLPAGRGGVDGSATVHAELILEGGGAHELVAELGSAPVVAATRGYSARFVPLGLELPLGCHELRLTGTGWDATSVVISAPSQAFWPTPAPRDWGVLLPLHAVWHKDKPGVGTFADLEAIARALHPRGGTVVATLPLLACWLDGRPEPNPYAPASRLMWNELYVDVAAPNAPTRPRQGLLAYQTLAAAQHDALSRAAVPVSASPVVEQYARFRAVAARLGRRWRRWPTDLRRPPRGPGVGDPATELLHRFAQREADRQLGEVATALAGRGQRLLLDLPLGTHPDAFDCWYLPGLFRDDVTLGAPPDEQFPHGQDWGAPAIDPDASRRTGHAHLRDCLRHQMRHAGLLRLDRVGGLHHQWWIPAGARPSEGVPVRHPTEELFALVCLESHRHGSIVVGEDRGGVPDAVRSALARHGLLRLHVAQFDGARPSARTVAAVNTPDLPTLAGWRASTDIADRSARGLLDPATAAAAKEERRRAWRTLTASVGVPADDGDAEPTAVIGPLLEALGRSDAPLVLANVEDLWGEIRPHNVPGTGQERPNWRRRTARPLEEILGDGRVSAVWTRLKAARQG
jgi:4-alpha-glucanotransferase